VLFNILRLARNVCAEKLAEVIHACGRRLVGLVCFGPPCTVTFCVMYMKCFEWPSAVKLLAVLRMSSVLPVDVLQHICETARFTTGLLQLLKQSMCLRT